MYRAFTPTSVALTLRRWRGRFGITAPRVTVRTHVPWYWRALGVATTGAVALALVGWVYDAGRRIAGFDRSETAQEISALKSRNAELESELEKLRAFNNASDSSLQIERTAQQQLTSQVKALEAENNRLKEEVAVFERLAHADSKDGIISLSRLKVFPEGAAGHYRYQFFLALNGDQRGKEFKGQLQLVVQLQSGSSDDMITFPRPNESDLGRYLVVLKHFRRFDGAFTVPSGAKVKSVEARVVQDGSVRTSQATTL